MDFDKAYDKAPHKHIQLKIYSISCYALNWITDFLKDRISEG